VNTIAKIVIEEMGLGDVKLRFAAGVECGIYVSRTYFPRTGYITATFSPIILMVTRFYGHADQSGFHILSHSCEQIQIDDQANSLWGYDVGMRRPEVVRSCLSLGLRMVG
jgi:hypothetical protein